MSPAFNLPQNITEVGDAFTAYMFYGAGGINFQVNQVFKFPKLPDSELAKEGVIQYAMGLSEFAPNQNRSAIGILNGNTFSENISPVSVFINALLGVPTIWKDFCAIPANANEGLTPTCSALVYEANNANAVGAAKIVTFTEYPYSYTLDSNPYKVPNYSFLNWNTKSDGTGTKYTNKQSVSLTGNFILYAVWSPTPSFVYSDTKISPTEHGVKITWTVTNGEFKSYAVTVKNNRQQTVAEATLASGARSYTADNLFAGHYSAYIVGTRLDGTTDTAQTAMGHLALIKVHDVSTFADLADVNSGRLDAISWLYMYGVTTGSPAGSNTYKPWDAVNRGAMAQFMRRVVKTPAVKNPPAPTFNDLNTGVSGRDDDIRWLASEKITVGGRYPGGFEPWNIVNRGQMAEFLYKLAGSPGAINPDPTDPKNHHVTPSSVADQESKFAADKDLSALKNTNPNRYYDILWLAQKGITIGSTSEPDGLLRYKPLDAVNRGAMAEFLKRTYDIL
jgi:hypothetical protein